MAFPIKVAASWQIALDSGRWCWCIQLEFLPMFYWYRGCDGGERTVDSAKSKKRDSHYDEEAEYSKC